MIIKGGMITWAVMGDTNASIPTCEPQLYRPMFGAYPAVIARTCVTFVSGAAYERGVRAGARPAPPVEPVRGCRAIGKAQMVRNDPTPHIDVTPRPTRCAWMASSPPSPPAERLPLAQLFFLTLMMADHD